MSKNRLRELRLKRGIGRDEFATLCETSGTQIWRLETGERKIYNAEWMKLCSEKLHCHPSELLPLEWQEPKKNINEQIFEEIMLQILPIYDKFMAQDNPITHERYTAIIAIIYNRYLCKNIKPKEAEITQLFRSK